MPRSPTRATAAPQPLSNTSIQMYGVDQGGLASSLSAKGTKNAASGDYQGRQNLTIESPVADARRLQTTTNATLKAIAPIEEVRREEPAGHPDRVWRVVRRVQLGGIHRLAIGEQPVQIGQPGSPNNEVVVLHLKPTASKQTHAPPAPPRWAERGGLQSNAKGTGPRCRRRVPTARPGLPGRFRPGSSGARRPSASDRGRGHEDGRGTSVWDTFSHTPARCAAATPATSPATSTIARRGRPRPAPRVGLGAFRFSIAWPRVQPRARRRQPAGPRLLPRSGRGPARARDHARDHALPLGPAATARGRRRLGQPRHGGAVRRVREIVAPALGDADAIWITINEPQVVANQGYRLGIHAPGQDRPRARRGRDPPPAARPRARARGRCARLPGARAGIALDLHPVRALGEDAEEAARSPMPNRTGSSSTRWCTAATRRGARAQCSPPSS